MKTSDFDYELLPESIAQTPVEPRDSSRLLVLKCDTGSLEHRTFSEIGEYLRSGDLLVVNKTRVIPARIYARKHTGGRVEVLLLRRDDLLTWECLVGGKGLSAGKIIAIENGPSAEILEVLEGSRRRMRFTMSRCRPIFTKNWSTRNVTRLFMRATLARQQPRPRVCISLRGLWMNSGARVLASQK
jgi:S-adenosylmethionine:tRNA ribosyltransferase-isomerase